MVLSWAIGCEDADCTRSELERLDLSLVLSFVGLAVAAAALLGSVVKTGFGLSFLAMHVVVFAINLGVYWDLGDTPGIFLPLAALAAMAGYVGVGGRGLASERRDSSIR
jgi:hypothetical protein